MAEEKKGKSDSILCQNSPWKDRDNNIWLVSTLKFYRNLNNFKFPGHLEGDKRKQICSLLEKALSEDSVLADPLFFPAEDLDPLHKDYLIEQFFGTESLQRAHVGDAFVLDKSMNFLAIVNIRDHLQLQITDYDGELEDSLNKLISVESALGKSLSYAFDAQFGFLTANPENCGAGLSVNTYLQVPCLIHGEHLAAIVNKCRNEGIIATGLLGDQDKFPGDILVLQNNYSLGISEESILSSVRTCATKIIVEEQAKRSQLRQNGGEVFKDKISRAYGLLTHSYQIETIEAMDALGLLKLGSDIGWVEGISSAGINELFSNCRRAHLTSCIGKKDREPDKQELPKLRANYLRTAMEPTSLQFS